MIKFTLRCGNDHEFESWFSNGDAFDTQARRQLVACPSCGNTDVKKALMAPNISKRGDSSSVNVPVRGQSPVPDAIRQEFVAFASKVAEKLKETSEHVGDKFAEEARNIHNLEAPARAIWGEATREDVEDLIDEGIDVMPLPPSPKDHN